MNLTDCLLEHESSLGMYSPKDSHALIGIFAVSIVAVEKKLGPRLGINFLQVEEK